MSSQKSLCLDGKTGQFIYEMMHSDQVPAWMHIDVHIKHGYRCQLHGVVHCFLSLFYKHNELVNAWSHLIPAVAYLSVLLRADYTFWKHESDSIQGKDNLMVQLYAASSAVCLLCSVRRHI